MTLSANTAPPSPAVVTLRDDRSAVLARIREALRTPAPPPVPHADGHHEMPPSEPSPLGLPVLNYRQWLPAVGPSLQDRIALFKRNALELKADFRLVPSVAAAAEALQKIAVAEGWKRISLHSGDLVEAAAAAVGLPAVRTDAAYSTAELEACDAGITQCDALIAQTGSVLLTTRSAGGRALSVLPPHHVVLATADQLLPDLPAAYALLRQKYENDWPSFMTLITGPSRTGDIERILVLGAHGPKRLTLILINFSNQS